MGAGGATALSVAATSKMVSVVVVTQADKASVPSSPPRIEALMTDKPKNSIELCALCTRKDQCECHKCQGRENGYKPRKECRSLMVECTYDPECTDCPGFAAAAASIPAKPIKGKRRLT